MYKKCAEFEIWTFASNFYFKIISSMSLMLSPWRTIRWNAALVIQRNWRYHFYITNRNHPQSSPRNKRNKSWHGCYSYKNTHSHYDSPRDNSKGRAICQHRGRSCALITRFLVDLRHGPLKMKFCFRGYIK